MAYAVSLFVIVISMFISLYFKSELERMFHRKKEVVAFHICNVLIILMVAFAAHVVTAIYIMGIDVNLLLQYLILIFIILPIYIAGNVAFEKYKFINRKYTAAENGKVLVINEKYLKKKS